MPGQYRGLCAIKGLSNGGFKPWWDHLPVKIPVWAAPGKHSGQTKSDSALGNTGADGLILPEQAASLGAAESQPLRPRGDQGTCCCWEIAISKGHHKCRLCDGKNIGSHVFTSLSRGRRNWWQDSARLFSASVKCWATKEGARKRSGKLSSSKLMCWPGMLKSSEALKKIIPVFKENNTSFYTYWRL